MVLLTSSATYLEQSSLLISARPTTTRITTHYSLPRTKPARRTRARTEKSSNTQSVAAAAAPSSSSPSSTPSTTPAAILTLKTYDPVSGVVLQYKTNRAAEVGRLMAALGRLGYVMARGRDETGGENLEAEQIGQAEERHGGLDGKEEQIQSGTASASGGGKGKRKKGGRK